MTIPEGFSPKYVEQQEALIADLRRMLNESAAVHADLKESMIKAVADVAIWRTRAERAEAALAEIQKPCVWRSETHGETLWYSGCGQTLWFEEGVPDDEYKFCPYCGHTIEMICDYPERAALSSRNDLLSDHH